jgi:hypothetical protein
LTNWKARSTALLGCGQIFHTCHSGLQRHTSRAKPSPLRKNLSLIGIYLEQRSQTTFSPLYESRAEEPQYDEDEDNPFVAYLKELAANHGAAIDAFGPRSTWYRVCQAEANDLAGEDERLANGILNGWVLIHDMPRELLKKDAVSERLEWMRPKIEDAYRAVLGSLGEQEEAK